jgi:hypothetical protein
MMVTHTGIENRSTLFATFLNFDKTAILRRFRQAQMFFIDVTFGIFSHQ